MSIAYLPQTLEECLGRGDVPALSENGLDDDRGGVRGRGLLLQKQLERTEGCGRERFRGDGCGEGVLVPVREGDGEGAGLYVIC